jgi:hypothetical protein
MDKPKVKITQKEIDRLKAVKAAVVNNNQTVKK